MFSEYLAALCTQWVALMSGIVSLLIGIGLRIGRHVSGKNLFDIPDWIFFCIGIVCLFFAGYKTWNDKNIALIALQEKLKAPEFVGEILQVTEGNINGLPVIAASGRISNPFGPPSSIVNWQMSVEFPSGKRLQGEFPLFTGRDSTAPLLGTGSTITFPVAKYWPDICTQPIPTGGSTNGWLMTTFEGLDFKEAHKENALLIIKFHDVVADRAHTLSYPMNRIKGVRLPSANMPNQ